MNNSHSGKYQRPRVSRFRILRWVVAAIVSLGVGVGLYGWQSRRAQGDFQALAARSKETTAVTTAPTVPTTAPPETTAETAPPETEPPETEPPETEPPAPEILPRFQELAAENPDLWGWVTIPDTVVDYPVMHTPKEPQKYLNADFSGAYSYPGTPFLDASCTSESDNLMVYAHNMMDGTMFRPLLKYGNLTYAKAHPTFRLDTLYEEREYQVVCAFYDRVYYAQEDVFKFYQFINATDAEEFDQVVAKIKAKSLYDTGVNPQYGDQLAMLITCSSHTDNGRFVLVGCYSPSEREDE